MNAKILWAVVGGFLVGVFVRSFVALSWPFAALLLLLGVVAAVATLIDSSKRNELIIVSVACIACALGIMHMDGAAQKGDPQLEPYLGKNVIIEGIVFAEPDGRDSSVRISLRADKMISKGATTSIHAGILAVAAAHTEVEYGDTVRVTGKLELPESFDTGLGRTFNYPMFLAKDGILYTLSFAQVTSLGENRGNNLKAAAIQMKQAYLHGLRQVLPEPESGLAGGITVGDKRSIGSELSDVFQKVSLIHVVVLSGYNITIVISAVTRALQWFSHYVRFGVAGMVVIFFVLMAGGAASAVRAGAMALIAIFARVTKRTFIATRALGVVALGMVAWNPYVLAFDPGFQLSALATLGLILFTPICYSWLTKIPERFGVREILASTIGTQLMVLPLLLYQNGTLSIVALPANLFALIAVPYAMFFSIVAALFGMFFGHIAALFALPAYALLAYVIKIAQIFATLPFASVALPSFSAWLLLAAYSILFAVYANIKRNRREEAPTVRVS